MFDLYWVFNQRVFVIYFYCFFFVVIDVMKKVIQIEFVHLKVHLCKSSFILESVYFFYLFNSWSELIYFIIYVLTQAIYCSVVSLCLFWVTVMWHHTVSIINLFNGFTSCLKHYLCVCVCLFWLSEKSVFLVYQFELMIKVIDVWEIPTCLYV